MVKVLLFIEWEGYVIVVGRGENGAGGGRGSTFRYVVVYGWLSPG